MIWKKEWFFDLTWCWSIKKLNFLISQLKKFDLFSNSFISYKHIIFWGVLKKLTKNEILYIKSHCKIVQTKNITQDLADLF